MNRPMRPQSMRLQSARLQLIRLGGTQLQQTTRRLNITLTVCLALVLLTGSSGAADDFLLEKEHHVAYIGNNLADRMQHHAWLETYIHALHPEHELTFRNLGFTGDEVKTRPRSDNFGSPDQWLENVQADVVFCFFGYNEALRYQLGESGQKTLASFESDLADMIDDMRGKTYNGESAPRLIVFSPIAHENLKSPHLPDGSENNAKLEVYTESMARVCKEKDVRFVDLFHTTRELYSTAPRPLTMNGVHLLDHGNEAVARIALNQLFPEAIGKRPKLPDVSRLREAVLEKNYYWFSRYRVVDGYNVYGGRSRLAWHGQSNADVMRREMEIFDVMTANRDARIWAVAQGGDVEIDDSNVPELLTVKTNKPGKLEGERHPYLGGKEAIEKMQIAEGLEVNLFASEEMFPEVVNPVQMAVDTDGRLFVSVWPSYPHWNPTLPRKDRIVCLPDENRDGIADECIIFADGLNSVTGFEFWGGGMIVAALPELWFLKDTDGDDRADHKVRILQGVSSADSHHSANAMVVGPDGWVYWSRGIFNIANMETPTRTYRSKASGVHRFNPRTFEVEFWFPIGPNPHGDIFDQWGYQFANDGTSGTGSYVNLGKGIGNRQWFKKRMRPVAATGILSSSHFPERYDGNFLVCNTITDLAVLQHEVKCEGADIRAVEIEPIIKSSDPNFRPTDVEIGSDGALYVSDWCNVLIGHMQHNMRDPNRDTNHGRIYRVTAKGRDLVPRVRLKGKPVETVLGEFLAHENSRRYRARLELSGRNPAMLLPTVASWAAKRDVAKPKDAQALLECLWVYEEHRVPNVELAVRVFEADEARVRAAAIRTLGHWGGSHGGGSVPGWADLLVVAARDGSPLVRAEALKAAVEFSGLTSAEVVFEAATRPTDSELDRVLAYAKDRLQVDKIVDDAVASGAELSPAAEAYVLKNASVEDLLKFERTEAVFAAILDRDQAPESAISESLEGLAKIRDKRPLELLFEALDKRVADGRTETLSSLGRVLTRQPASELAKVTDRLETIATKGAASELRQLAYAAWMTGAGSADDAFLAASQSKAGLRDFLEAVPLVDGAELRASLYAKVQPLLFEMPAALDAEPGGSALGQQGLLVEYYHPSADNVAIETLDKLKPKASGIVPKITLEVPQRKEADAFALRFTGSIQTPKSGNYTFYTNSDDGSRLYIGDKLVVNNDGKHGMVEKRGRINLPAGSHPIVVTYFDNGGNDGLIVRWKGPGFKKQAIAEDRLTVSGGGTLHDLAISTLKSIPGHEEQKVRDLVTLVKAGEHQASSIYALRQIPLDSWPETIHGTVVDNLVGYLTSMPANFRTSGPALDAIALAESLATKIPEDAASALRERLKNLNVQVIAIGTVPHRMIFDKEVIAIEAGKTVEFRFSNTDDMPHNFAIVEPGSLQEVGELAEETSTAPDVEARHYVPKTDKVILASKLLQPGERQALSYEAPKEPGVYPYVCTYPGHWRRMYGTLYVVASLEEYQADPEAYLAANPLEIRDELLTVSTRGREWTYDELISSASPLPPGRQFKVGKELFKVAGCVACHRLGDEGKVFGPDLAKLDEKKRTPEYLLRSLLEPSKDIEEKYRSHSFVLQNGKVIIGMIVKDSPTTVEVVIDPAAKDAATPIEKSSILNQTVSEASIMPEGLLSKLSREEILDLLGYIYAGGDMKNEIFAECHDH